MQGAVSRQADGTLALELSAAEHVFPIPVEQGGEEYVALFHMTPPTQAEVVSLLDGTVGEFQPRGRNKILIEPAPRDRHADLFDRHFVRLGGLEGDPSVEEQKAWLDRRPTLKQRVVQEGYGGAAVVLSLNGSGLQKGLRLTEIAANEVRLAWKLWSAETKATETVTVLHVLRPETAEEARLYAKATRRFEAHVRTDVWRVLTDHAAMCKLYDALAERLGNCLVGGEPCAEGNKGSWLPLVPPWQKVAVVQEVFAGASPKNA